MKIDRSELKQLILMNLQPWAHGYKQQNEDVDWNCHTFVGGPEKT